MHGAPQGFQHRPGTLEVGRLSARHDRQRAGLRPQRATGHGRIQRVGAQAVQAPRMVFGDADHEVQLQVGRGQGRVGLEEATGLRVVAADGAGAVAHIAANLARGAPQPGR